MSSRVRPLIPRITAALLAAWATAYAAGAMGAPPTGPGVGRFLVATRQVPGGFARSVILLVGYDSTGALGLIVNRPTKLLLADLLSEVDELKGRRDPVYLGGPVSIDHLMLLVRSKAPPPAAAHVVGDVYASASVDTLRAVAGKTPAGARFRAYVGYAGWGAGQLDFEIARGDWLVVPADADGVFTEDPSGLWQELIRSQGLIKVKFERR